MNQELPIYKEIASRLAGLRDAMDLSIEEMARQLNIPADHIKKFESGTQDIPVSFIFSVAKLCQVDPTVLMSGTESHLHNYSLVKADNAMTVNRRKDYDYHSLAYRFSKRKMEPFRVEVHPKKKSELTFNEHPGQEFIHMMEGRLEVFLGDEAIVLEPGDSLYFNSHIPHAMRALGDKNAIFLDVLA